MNNKKLNAADILNKAGGKYQLLKEAKYGVVLEFQEIKSNQIKAVVEVLVEEINKILEE